MLKIRGYTEEEINFIKDNYLTMSTYEIAEKLGRKYDGINRIGRKLGFVKQVHNKWTNEEIEFLKEHYIDMTSEEMTKYINHTVDAINTQRDRLKLVRNESWSDEEVNFLKNNYYTMTIKEIGIALNRTEGAVGSKISSLNLDPKERSWTEEEEEYVRKNYVEMATKDIAEHLGRSHIAVKIKAKKMGLKKSPYFCDYHYFDNIDTEEKAYWLGFLSADGWIWKNLEMGSGVVGIELQYGDIDHLKKFNKSIKGNYKITDRWRTCSISTNKTKKHHTCLIRIFSIIMYNSLTSLGFSSNKSYDFTIPKIKTELLRHYFRGYFDGDGCLSFTHNKNLSVQFATASKLLNEDIQKTLDSLNIDNIYEYQYITEFDTNMYRLSINRIKDKIKFLDWIYQDANIYLDRKYNKYLLIKQKYNNTQTTNGLAC